MRPDEIDRWLGRLGESYAELDVDAVIEGFRERLRRLPDDPSARARIDELATRVVPERLTEEAPADAAELDEAPVGDLAAVIEDVDVLVRVLGEVAAVRPAGRAREVAEPLVPTRQRGLEAVAYLALRASPVDLDDLESTLFPHGTATSESIDHVIGSARALVGEDLLLLGPSGRVELSERVASDLGLFVDLVAQADETDDAEVAADLLRQALGLVRGEPFTGVGRSYAWAAPRREMIVARVVDAAEELAELRLAAGDWRSAEWAARRGLTAFPSDERLYRLLMRTARAAGNIPGVQRVYRELCDVLADPDMGADLEDTAAPETVQLFQELTGSAPAHGHDRI